MFYGENCCRKITKTGDNAAVFIDKREFETFAMNRLLFVATVRHMSQSSMAMERQMKLIYSLPLMATTCYRYSNRLIRASPDGAIATTTIGLTLLPLRTLLSISRAFSGLAK